MAAFVPASFSRKQTSYPDITPLTTNAMKETTADVISANPRDRVCYYAYFLFENVTPLLRKEINHATKVHSEAFQQSDVDSDLLKALDNVHLRLTQHWAKVFQEPISRALLTQQISFFQRFLTDRLLEVYTGKPYQVDQWHSTELRIFRQRDDLGQMYYDFFTWPLEEMMLDQDHVQDTLVTAAAEPQSADRAKDIRSLIARCDWPSLARALVKDRELAIGLFDEEPIDPEYYNTNTRKKVLRGIEKVRDKYFEDLSDPAKYTISKHAMGLSPVQPAADERLASTSIDEKTVVITTRETPEPTTKAGQQSKTTARDLIHTLLGGLGSGGLGQRLRPRLQISSPGKSGSGWDETSPLVKLKKAE